MGIIRIKKEVLENWLANKSTPPRNIEEVAAYINISPSLLSLILAGKRQITTNVQRKLCDLTGYDIGDLCFYDRNGEITDSDTDDKK